MSESGLIQLVDSARALLSRVSALYWPGATVDNGVLIPSVASPSVAGLAKTTTSTSTAVSTDDARVIDASSYASLSAAVTATGSIETTLNVSTALTVSASMTVPANVTLRKIGAGQLTIASGQTLTILGSVTAPRRQFFAGLGTVTFAGNSQVAEVFPEWWGAKANYTTSSTVALQAAITAAQTNGAALSLSRGGYLCDGLAAALLTISAPIEFAGKGKRSSFIVVANSVGTGTYALLIKPPAISTTEASTALSRGYHLHDFGIISEGGIELNTSYSGGHGLVFDTTVTQSFLSETSIERLFIGPLGPTGGVYHGILFVDDQVDGEYVTRNVVFNECQIINGAFLYWHGDMITFKECLLQGEGYGIFATAASGGVSGLKLDRCTITNKLGGKITNAQNFKMTSCFVELPAGTSGIDGATFSLLGDAPGAIISADIDSCTFGTPGGPDLDGLYIENAYSVMVKGCLFNLNTGSGKAGVNVGPNTFGTAYDENNWLLQTGTVAYRNESNDPGFRFRSSPTVNGFAGSITDGYSWIEGIKAGANSTHGITGMFTGFATAVNPGSIPAGSSYTISIPVIGVPAGTPCFVVPAGNAGQINAPQCWTESNVIKAKIVNDSAASITPNTVDWIGFALELT